MPNCHAIQQSDEMFCGPCNLRWDVNDSDPPPCRKSFPTLERLVAGGSILKVETLTPPAVTADDVKRRRERTGKGMAECLRELNHERLLAMIQMFDLHGDRKALTEILFALAEERR